MEHQQQDHAGETDQGAQDDALYHAFPVVAEVQSAAADLEQGKVGQDRQEIPGHGLGACGIKGTHTVGPDVDIGVGVAEDQQEDGIGIEEENQGQNSGFQNVARAETLTIRGSKSVGFRGGAQFFPTAKW